jgi:HD-like signal output (HDOD) protein
MSTSGLYAPVFRDILAGQTNLPSLPDVAVRIRQALQEEGCDTARVTRVVQGAPPVAAYLVRLANSPLYRGRVPVEDVKSAVSRFGLEGTRNLVTTYTLKNLFVTDQPLLGRMLRALWGASARLAALSAVLARHLPGFDPDRAMLAGLLQDIGALPLITRLARRRDLLADAPAARRAVADMTPRVGVLLLRQWGMDEQMQAVAASREDWHRDGGPLADLADLVLIARLHAYAGTPLMRGCPRMDQIPAFRKLPVGALTPESSLAVLAAAQEEVAAVHQVLGG